MNTLAIFKQHLLSSSGFIALNNCTFCFINFDRLILFIIISFLKLQKLWKQRNINLLYNLNVASAINSINKRRHKIVSNAFHASSSPSSSAWVQFSISLACLCEHTLALSLSVTHTITHSHSHVATRGHTLTR